MEFFPTNDLDINPFAAGNGAAAIGFAGPKENIHIRFYKQGKRAITILEGLDEDLDQNRIAKALKRCLSCASSVHTDTATGKQVIKLQGDQCQAVKDWLLAQEILTQKEAAERLVIHGQ